MDTKCQNQRRCINFYFLYTVEPFSCDYIYQMRQRNIEYCEFNIHDKKLYFIIDHATALIAWRKAYDEGSICRDAILFHLDKHTDYYMDPDNINKSKKILEMANTELNDFVMNELSGQNDEFIVNAMCSGLIKDGISFHCDEGSDFGKLIEENQFTPRKSKFICDGIEHNFYLFKERDISRIDNILSYQELNKLCKCSRDFILDIDLDFFTKFTDKTISMTPEEIYKQINCDLFKKMLELSKVITIALEPAHCGGNEQCEKIFDSFMSNDFFKFEENSLSDLKHKFLYSVNSEDFIYNR